MYRKGKIFNTNDESALMFMELWGYFGKKPWYQPLEHPARRAVSSDWSINSCIMDVFENFSVRICCPKHDLIFYPQSNHYKSTLPAGCGSETSLYLINQGELAIISNYAWNEGYRQQDSSNYTHLLSKPLHYPRPSWGPIKDREFQYELHKIKTNAALVQIAVTQNLLMLYRIITDLSLTINTKGIFSCSSHSSFFRF